MTVRGRSCGLRILRPYDDRPGVILELT